MDLHGKSMSKMEGSLRLAMLCCLIGLLGCNCSIAQTPQHLTLADLQGNWQWQYMQVQGRPLSRKSDYYATGLRINNDTFLMDFSEASCLGKIIHGSDVLILKPRESDKLTYHYQDSEVLEVRGDRLFILFRNHIWPLFEGKGRVAHIVYCYRKLPH